MPDQPASSSAGTASGRLPPYSDEAEKGVLGSVLQDARILDLCIENHLVSESFYVPAHKLIYEILEDMARHGHPIDVLTVADKLKETGRLDRVGGEVFLHRLVDATPTTAHAGYYMDIVRQKHVLRRIIECARNAENECYGTEEDARSLLGRVEQSFFDITDLHRVASVSWQEMVKAVIAKIDTLGHGDDTLITGFGGLDRNLAGLRAGNMIILAARPSMGKTSLAMNIAENIACGHLQDESKAKAVGIFSLEMSQEDLVMRMLCTHAEVSMHKIRSGYLSGRGNEHGRLIGSANRIAKAPIFLDDSAALDVMELRARARRMKQKHDVRLIVVDYLQLLHHREYARQGRQIETGAVSGCLKAMAKELNLPVLVLSQLSRAPEAREGIPRLSDLRDSGSIEQDADVVLLLRRPCRIAGDPEFADKRLGIVEIAKNRNGPTLSEIRLDFDEEITRFRDRKEQGVDGVGVEEHAEVEVV